MDDDEPTNRTDLALAALVGAALGAGIGLLARNLLAEDPSVAARSARLMQRARRSIPPRAMRAAAGDAGDAVRDAIADARASAERALAREVREFRRALRRRRRRLGL